MILKKDNREIIEHSYTYFRRHSVLVTYLLINFKFFTLRTAFIIPNSRIKNCFVTRAETLLQIHMGLGSFPCNLNHVHINLPRSFDHNIHVNCLTDIFLAFFQTPMCQKQKLSWTQPCDFYRLDQLISSNWKDSAPPYGGTSCPASIESKFMLPPRERVKVWCWHFLTFT